MPSVTLDAGDAIELTETLAFLAQWLARDPARLAASLEDFAGNPGYGIQHLRDDLDASSSCSAAATASSSSPGTTTSPAKGGSTTTDQPAQ